MSRFPELRHTQVLPTLPVELVDDIIDEASRTLDISSISSIALTSHALRNHANKVRFSALVPFRWSAWQDIQHTAESIKNLASVIRTGHSIATMPGVCTFATSFSLQMIGFYDEVMPALEDGNLAYVFNNLFRPPHTDTPNLESTTSIRSLSLYVYRWSRGGHDDEENPRYDGLIWNLINSELLKALEDLLQFSQLNRLSLNVMRNLPRDFLLGSKIKHLYLRRVSVGLYRSHNSNDNHDRNQDGNIDTTRRGEPVPLESLDIDGSVSIVDLGLIAHPESDMPASLRYTFPCLTQFSIDVTYALTFKVLNEVLRSAPALKALYVRLWIDHNQFLTHQNDIAIEYDHPAYLESISFTNGVGTHLSVITHLLKPDATLKFDNLHITLSVPSPEPLTVVRYLEDINVSILDKHLIHPSFVGIKHITIGLGVEVLAMMRIDKHIAPDDVTSLCAYIAGRFPLLSEKNADRLQIIYH